VEGSGDWIWFMRCAKKENAARHRVKALSHFLRFAQNTWAYLCGDSGSLRLHQ